MFGEATGEVFFTGCDEVAHFVVAGKLGAFVKGARGIDLPGFPFSPVPATFVFGAVAVCRAPLAGGGEVFEAESDRVDLARWSQAPRLGETYYVRGLQGGG